MRLPDCRAASSAECGVAPRVRGVLRFCEPSLSLVARRSARRPARDPGADHIQFGRREERATERHALAGTQVRAGELIQQVAAIWIVGSYAATAWRALARGHADQHRERSRFARQIETGRWRPARVAVGTARR